MQIKNREVVVSVDGTTYWVECDYDTKIEDRSFSHLFGIERRSILVVDDIDIHSVTLFDGGDDREIAYNPELWEKLKEELYEVIDPN
jgi:hypothetical protein